MYAAVRSDSKASTFKSSNGSGSFDEEIRRSDSSSSTWASRRFSSAMTANGRRTAIPAHPSKTPEIDSGLFLVDEWELLDETLGDRHHYFTHHSRAHSPDDGDEGDGGSSHDGCIKPNFGQDDQRRRISHGKLRQNGPNWTNLPNHVHHATESAVNDADDESQSEDDGEPLTTLDSIIAAAKRLSTGRLSITSTTKGTHPTPSQSQSRSSDTRDTQWTADEPRTSPRAQRIGSLQFGDSFQEEDGRQAAAGTEENGVGKPISKGHQNPTTKLGNQSADGSEGNRTSPPAHNRPSAVSRGFSSRTTYVSLRSTNAA